MKKNLSYQSNSNPEQANIDYEYSDIDNKQISGSLFYLKKEKNSSSNSMDFDIISEEDVKNYSQSLYVKKKNYKTDTKFANNLNDKNSIRKEASANQQNSNNNLNQNDLDSQNEQGSENEDEATYSKINILKESILLETKQTNVSGIWNSFASKFSNFKNYLKYNVISTNRQLRFSELSYITLFDKSFSHNQFSTAEFNLALEKIFSYTYRTHFSDLLPVNGIIYNTDCGWGCMIRAGQMMLSKAVLEFKLHQLGKEKLISQEEVFDLKLNVLKLFFDNLISFEEKEFLDQKDFAFFLKNYLKILNEEEKKNKEINSPKMKFSENICSEEDFQNKLSQNGLTVKGVYAPFSIQNITKLGILYDAGPGVWFSDAKVIKVFKEIEEQLNVLNSEVHIFSFDSGVISEKDIIEECFEEVEFNCIKDYEECENYNNSNNLDNTQKKIISNNHKFDKVDCMHSLNINKCFSINFEKNENQNEENDIYYEKRVRYNHFNNEDDTFSQSEIIDDNNRKNKNSSKKLNNLLLQTKISISDYDNDKFEEEININLPFENNLHKKNLYKENANSNNRSNYISESICTKCLAKQKQNNKQAFRSEILEIDFFNCESENKIGSPNYAKKTKRNTSLNFSNNDDESSNNNFDNDNNTSTNKMNNIEKTLKQINIQKKFYKLKKCGFIFISVRHGLHSIEKEYHRSIKQFFKIPYNLGIIGGKANSAFYFVGEHQERLIYLDPHLSQKAVENLSLLYENGYESYEPKYFYYLDIKNMSPGFTMGFYFRTVEEYKELANALYVHSDSKFNLFTFEKLGEIKKFKKKASAKKDEEIKFKEVIEDDFSVIDIEDDC